MDKLLIMVDICNTLADINGILEKELGSNPTPSSYHHPGANEAYFLNNLWVFSSAKAIEGSSEVLNNLSKIYSIAYVTRRPIQAHEITEKWLKYNLYPEGYLIHSQNKSRIAKVLNPFFAIDDAPNEIESYIENGIKVYVKKQPYNTFYNNRFEWNKFSIQA